MEIHEQMKVVRKKTAGKKGARLNRLREVLLGDNMDEISGVLLQREINSLYEGMSAAAKSIVETKRSKRGCLWLQR